MMLVTVSFTILSLGPIFKSGSGRRIVQPLRNNTGQTLVHQASWHTTNGTLFSPLLIFLEQGNMEPLNEHLTNLKHPQSSMEPLNRREPDDYRSSVNTRFANKSAIIKVKLLFNGSTSQRMEKEHLAKLAPTSQWGALYSIIFLPPRVEGCISASSKGARLWNLKHPILKAFSKH